MIFAKLIDLEDGEQVLITIDYDSESEEYKMNVQTDLDHIRLKLTFGFDKAETSRKEMQSWDLKKAQQFRDNMYSKLIDIQQ